MQHTHTTPRLIAHIEGAHPGPTMIFVGGLHGNEPAAPAALYQLAEYFHEVPPSHISGNIVALQGNLKALRRQQRYLDTDLNRLWSGDNVAYMRSPEADFSHCAELEELQQLTEAILHYAQLTDGPVYCIDLHSTSAPTKPFSPLSGHPQNLNFARRLPVPMILGIEKFVPDTMLHYFSERHGFICVGFEAGQHHAPETTYLHLTFCHIALHEAGIYTDAHALHAIEHMQQATEGNAFYHIRFVYVIHDGEDFEMLPGFESFDPIANGQHLANNRHGHVKAPLDGYMFMPLYQKLGTEGFFLIEKTA